MPGDQGTSHIIKEGMLNIINDKEGFPIHRVKLERIERRTLVSHAWIIGC